MKTSIKYTLIGFTGGLLLSVGMAGFAFGPMHPFGHFMGQDAEGRAAFREFATGRIGQQLNLDGPQMLALKELADTLGATRETMVQNREQVFTQVQGIIQGPTFNRAGALALVEEKTTKVQNQAPQIVASLAGFYDGLHPAQQQQLRGWLAERGEHWAAGHQR